MKEYQDRPVSDRAIVLSKISLGAHLPENVEAKPADGANLPIGLPVTVMPLGE